MTGFVRACGAMVALALGVLCLGFPVDGHGQPGEKAAVEVKDLEDGLRVSGDIHVPASREAVWAVVTDFDRLAEFTPDLKVSRTVGRNADGAIRLEQVSRQGVLFFHRDVRVLLRVALDPMTETRYSLIDGDFKTYEGNWRLRAAEGGIEVSLTLTMVPDFFAPAFIQRRVAEQGAAKALEAVRREVLRRKPGR